MPNYKLIFYTFLAVAILKVVLGISSRFLMNEALEAFNKSVEIKNEFNEVMHFEDSLSGSETFRKKLLDTANNVDKILQAKQTMAKSVHQKMMDLENQHPNREITFTLVRFVDPLQIVLNVLLACLGLPLMISFFRKRL
jgi:hypothetical protein